MEIIAHRGLWTKNVENSLPAFKDAENEQADAIELDVHQTKDGKLAVFHDFNLKRIFGIDENIYDKSWDELSNLKFPGYDYGIPLLEDVLRFINLKLYIEIKSIDEKGRRYYPEIIEKLRDELMKYGRNDTVISFDPFPVLYARSVYNLITGLDIDSESLILLGENNLDFYINHTNYIIPEWSLINKFEEVYRNKIITWTINDMENYKKAEKMNIYGIISDRVDIILRGVV